jgi:hypothetical protein
MSLPIIEKMKDIPIVCKESTEVDPILLRSIHRRFRPCADANITMSGVEIIDELIQAYLGDYLQEMAQTAPADDTEEEALARMAVIDVAIFDCIIDDKPKAILLARAFRESSESHVAEIERIFNRNPLSMADEELKGKFSLWSVLKEKSRAE